MRLRVARLILAMTSLSAADLSVAARVEAADKVDYVQDVRPIFMRRCSRCHGANKHEAGLRLDAGQLILKGSENGPVVVPKKTNEGELLVRVAAKDESRMPPEGDRLADTEIGVIRRWVEQGASYPANELIPRDPARHWSFQVPRRPAVPVIVPAAKTSGSGASPGVGTANPIDAFLDARRSGAGCEAAGPAPRDVLLRRVTLDLTGVPPAADELRAFLADGSPDAYPRVVDRLLASPAYAERWARHWMDVWRYSDWYGYANELRNSARHIWRWRDWIVESIAADKPYDRMIVEMLAADELEPANGEALRATGYLARNYYLFNRNVWLDSTVEHTSKAFLGMTINCARCHDHIFDPVEQAEYYRFRAIFEPYRVRLDHVPGQPNTDVDGVPRAFDADLGTPTFLFVRGNDQSPDKGHPLSPGVPAAWRGPKWAVRPVDLPAPAYYPSLVPFVQRDALADVETARRDAEQRLSASLARLRALERPVASTALLGPGTAPTVAASAADSSLPSGAGRAEKDAAPAPAMSAAAKTELDGVRARCQVDELSLGSARAALGALKARIRVENARFAVPPDPSAHTLALAAAQAERLASLRSAEADVAAAQWQMQFGQTVAAKSRDTGRRKPTKPIDLAAAQKRLAEVRAKANPPGDQFTPLGPRYPTTSSGRRLALARWIASADNPLTARVAVNHVWLRHFGQPLVPTVFDFGLNGKPPTHPELLDWLAVEFMQGGWSMKRLHRLIVTSEAYRRDSLAGPRLAHSAAVDPDNHLLWRMNARRLESEAVRDSVLSVAGGLDRHMGGPELDSNDGETSYRRSIYYRHAPEKFMTFLRMFDSPNTAECYRRNETIVPQQALALANSTLAIDQARRLAGRLCAVDPRGTSQDGKFVDSLFETVLCREPTEPERTACREFLARQESLLADRAKLTEFTVGKPATVKGSADPRRRAREDLAHVLLNHSEFVTIR